MSWIQCFESLKRIGTPSTSFRERWAPSSVLGSHYTSCILIQTLCLHSSSGQWLICDITNYYFLMVCWARRISPASVICSDEVRDEAAHWNQAALVRFIRGLGSVYEQVAKRKAALTHGVRDVAWSAPERMVFIRADPCLDPALVSVHMAGVSQDAWALYRKALRAIKASHRGGLDSDKLEAGGHFPFLLFCM